RASLCGAVALAIEGYCSSCETDEQRLAASGGRPMTAPIRHHFRACNLCEAICGIDVATSGPSVQSIRGDRDDPLSRGHICPKALGLQDVHQDPDRLRHPLRRTRDGWERIGWSAAFDEVASRLKETQRQHGRDAVGIYLGNPNVHNYGTLLFL